MEKILESKEIYIWKQMSVLNLIVIVTTMNAGSTTPGIMEVIGLIVHT